MSNPLFLRRNIGSFTIYLAASRKWGVLFRLRSFWVGVHYSDRDRRVCVSLLPCLTVWFVLRDGSAPQEVL